MVFLKIPGHMHMFMRLKKDKDRYRNMKSSILAIVVVYNTSLSESVTCRNLLSMVNRPVMCIVDNSTIETDNLVFCEENQICYINMHGNKGTSKAYNQAINTFSDVDVYVLLDDDTEITEAYFTALETALDTQAQVDVFAPTIIGQDGIVYSPNRARFMKNKLCSSPADAIPQNEFNAIASCLAIRSRVFDGYRFNEDLFLDQVDQNLFDDLREAKKVFSKLDVRINQNFYQRGDSLDPEAGWERLKLRISDMARYSRLKTKKKYMMLGWIKCCGLGLQIALKARSIPIATKAMTHSTKEFFRAIKR